MVHVYKIPERKSFLSRISLTLILILLNVIFFILFTILLKLNPKLIDSIAIKPENILAGKYLWTFLTSMFMHGGFAHLLFNMFTLFFIGGAVEKIIGRKRYLWFYLASGIFAGIFFVLLPFLFSSSIYLSRTFGNISSYGVGASGAIFGLLGLLAVIIPKSKVYLVGGPILAIILQVTIPSFIDNTSLANFLNTILTIYILICIFAIFSFNPTLRRLTLQLGIPFWMLPFIAIVPLFVVGLFVELPIGNTAHLGGLILGLVYGLYLRKRYKRKTAYISQVFS